VNKSITTSMDDGIVTVWFDQPDKSVNTICPQTLVELSTVLDRINRGVIGENGQEAHAPVGVVFASAKPGAFIAGADLFAIADMDPEQVERFLFDGQELFNRITKLSIPTVAAINGDCLGGGYELALACNYRVAVQDGSINIGLPEVKLGILPGWGGSTRLPRLIGLTKALGMLLTGKIVPPGKAKKLGMIDQVVRPEALMAAAHRLAMTRPKRKKLALIDRMAHRSPFVQKRMFAKALKETGKKTYGHYPAPGRIIKAVRRGFNKGIAAGLAAERKSLVALTKTDACRNLMRLFFLRKKLKQQTAARYEVEPSTIKRAAVIGGGVMGAGIVHALLRKGIDVRLIEINEQAISAALGRVDKLLASDVRSGKLSELEAKHALNRLSPCTDWTGLKLVDIAIEAVVEKMTVKHEIFTKLDELTRPDCILASNTSSLSITEMAKATTRPQQVVGLHFFNPVVRMPLIEVIKTDQSDPHAVVTAVALATKLGKTPVVVNDAPGFVVNRLLVPYLAEALVMAGEGISIKAIDDQIKKWGMPMGPFELLDQIGLDIGMHVLRSLEEHLGDRITTPGNIDQAVEKQWLGKKSGRGFYTYNSKTPRVHRAMVDLLAGKKSSKEKQLDEQQARIIENRLILPMINEAAYLLEEQVIDSPDAIDLATVLGLGWAPFRGGLIHYANSLGPQKVIDQLNKLATEFGDRFTPAPALHQMTSASGFIVNAPAKRETGAASDTDATRRFDTSITEVPHGQA